MMIIDQLLAVKNIYEFVTKIYAMSVEGLELLFTKQKVYHIIIFIALMMNVKNYEHGKYI